MALADNGFGSKANSPDFQLRAYYLRPHFKTAQGGSGGVDVNGYIEFRDPHHRLGFPIVNEQTTRRLLTGADVDPESIQRDRKGDLWIGDEFGPWILHFSSTGVLLDAPVAVPGFASPDNPLRQGEATQPSSRGFEGMSISKNRKYLYAAFEGASIADVVADPLLRTIHEFSIRDKEFTGRSWDYHADAANHLISDMATIDNHRIMVLSRDSLRGEAVVFRSAYVVDLRKTDEAGFLVKEEVVDLTAIPDPDLVSLPAIHEGDVRIGDPFAVVCLSVEIIYRLSNTKYLIGCDNNFPDNGRNPARADDSEFIVVDIPAVKAHGAEAPPRLASTGPVGRTEQDPAQPWPDPASRSRASVGEDQAVVGVVLVREPRLGHLRLRPDTAHQVDAGTGRDRGHAPVAADEPVSPERQGAAGALRDQVFHDQRAITVPKRGQHVRISAGRSNSGTWCSTSEQGGSICLRLALVQLGHGGSGAQRHAGRQVRAEHRPDGIGQIDRDDPKVGCRSRSALRIAPSPPPTSRRTASGPRSGIAAATLRTSTNTRR